MTAIAISTPGGPEVLGPETRPVPKPGAGEILIRVAAAGVNRPDVAQRSGAYPPPPGASDLPGLEVSGTVVALGDGVERFRTGARVCALVNGGGYAPTCRSWPRRRCRFRAASRWWRPRRCRRIISPSGRTPSCTGRLAAGETLLVHGGTSGIGTTAIQLGKAFGARVIATAGSPAKCEAMRRLGVDRAIDYRTEDFVDAVKAATDGKGADVILDMVGGSYVERNYRAAAERGRIVQIAFLESAKAEVNFTLLMTKRLVHTGSTLRPRSVAEKAALANALEEKVWPLLAAGTVRPLIDRTFPLADAADAHRAMEASQHVGKIMLIVEEQA